MTAVAAAKTVGLTRLAKDINAAHRAAEAAGRERDEQVFLCGQKLIEAKQQVGHGNFIAWVEKHCEFERATAWRYMSFVKQVGNVSVLKHLPPGQYAQFATPPRPAPAVLAPDHPLAPIVRREPEPEMPLTAQEALARIKTLCSVLNDDILPTLTRAHLSPEGARFVANWLLKASEKMKAVADDLQRRNPPIGKEPA